MSTEAGEVHKDDSTERIVWFEPAAEEDKAQCMGGIRSLKLEYCQAIRQALAAGMLFLFGSSAAAERDLSWLGSPVQNRLSLGFESGGLTQVFQVNAVVVLHGVSQPPAIRTLRVHQ